MLASYSCLISNRSVGDPVSKKNVEIERGSCLVLTCDFYTHRHVHTEKTVGTNEHPDCYSLPLCCSSIAGSYPARGEFKARSRVHLSQLRDTMVQDCVASLCGNPATPGFSSISGELSIQKRASISCLFPRSRPIIGILFSNLEDACLMSFQVSRNGPPNRCLQCNLGVH